MFSLRARHITLSPRKSSYAMPLFTGLFDDTFDVAWNVARRPSRAVHSRSESQPQPQSHSRTRSVSIFPLQAPSRITAENQGPQAYHPRRHHHHHQQQQPSKTENYIPPAYLPTHGHQHHQVTTSQVAALQKCPTNQQSLPAQARDPYARPASVGATRSRYDSRASYDDDGYSSSDRERRSHRKSHSRKKSRSRSRSGVRGKLDKNFDKSNRGLTSGAIGAIAGGLVGNEVGKGIVPTLAGVVLGGLGANAYEARDRCVLDLFFLFLLYSVVPLPFVFLRYASRPLSFPRSPSSQVSVRFQSFALPPPPPLTTAHHLPRMLHITPPKQPDTHPLTQLIRLALPTETNPVTNAPPATRKTRTSAALAPPPATGKAGALQAGVRTATMTIIIDMRTLVVEAVAMADVIAMVEGMTGDSWRIRVVPGMGAMRGPVRADGRGGVGRRWRGRRRSRGARGARGCFLECQSIQKGREAWVGGEGMRVITG